MSDALVYIKQMFGGSPDVIVRIFQMGSHSGVRIAAVYLDGLSDKGKINDFVAQSLLLEPSEEELRSMDGGGGIFEVVLARTSTVGSARVCSDWSIIMHELLSGGMIILVDGRGEAIAGDLRNGEWRAISEPTTEVTVRGPKDCFIESIDMNIMLIRRRLKTPNLWLERFAVGNMAKTNIAFMFIHGVADERLVQEVTFSINKIRLNTAVSS